MKDGLREVSIDALAASGEGIAHVEGRALLVPGALPGERADVIVTRGHAALRALKTTSDARVAPRCEVFERCGGCVWQHASATLQREAALAIVRRALPPALRGFDIAWTPSPTPWGWRTRARLAWSRDKRGLHLGHRARGDADIVDTRRCPVLAPALEDALPALGDALASLRGHGEVSLALGAAGRPVASVRPSSERLLPGDFELCAKLVAQGFAGVALWPPGATEAFIVGDARPVTEGADGEPLMLAVEGFAQAHTTLNRALSATVLARAAARGRRVLELYAGAGNFTVGLAREASSVVAVESDRRAVAALHDNLRARSLANVTVRAEPAEQCIDGRAEVVVLDPPRTGAREVCEALVAAPRAKGVVYVACDAATLGRDLTTLTAAYEVRAMEVFEMFPHSGHVEIVTTLSRAAGARRPRGM